MTQEILWKSAVDKALKGKPFEKALLTKTYNDVTLQPLYHPTPPLFIENRGAQEAWKISALVDNPSVTDANKQALEDLNEGANSLTLVLANGLGARRGFSTNLADLKALFNGIYLDLIEVRIDGGTREAGLALQTFTDKATLHLGLDPLKPQDLSGLTSPIFASLFTIDGRHIHEAGGNEVQELGFCIASALHLSRLYGIEKARNVISFTLSADQDQFLTLAKFRALRVLWAKIEEAFKATPQSLNIHAETSFRMMTKTDSSVNWLRQTVAVFGAGLGGANSIQVLPHTAAFGLADSFSRRMARNMQLVLIEESNLHQVSDPASGAGGFERLTKQLAEQAWGFMQEIEKAGGIINALPFVKDEVANTHSARMKALATRKDALTGTSEFPNINEEKPSVLAVKAVKPTADYPYPSHRLSEPFEALREKAAKTKPKIFLAPIGTLADFTPRAGFTKNFFEAGGIEVLSSDGYETQAALIEAFKASGTKTVCICGTDASYLDSLTPLYEVLLVAGATKIYVAGKPANEGLEKIIPIFMGANLLDTLERFLD